jgi:hypothetical protein
MSKYLMASVVALSLVGCDSTPVPTKTAPTTTVAKNPDAGKAAKADDHAHGKGPNGGVVFDLGKYHAEFTVDHDKKECTILIVSEDDKDAKPAPVAAKEFTLTTKESKTKDGKAVPAMTIKMLAKDEKDGKAAKFVGTDPGLGNVADFEGTVMGEIDGKPSKGTFKE